MNRSVWIRLGMFVSCCLLVVGTPVSVDAAIVESTSRMITAGDFDDDGVNEIAYIRTTGDIFVQDFNQPQASWILPGVTAQALTAADLDADGVPEIAFINAVGQTLESYHAATGTFTTHALPAGVTSISNLSVGNTDGVIGDEIMVIGGGVPYVRKLDGTYVNTPGSDIDNVAGGNIIGTNAGDEFVVRNSSTGAPYLYRFDTNSYSVLGGAIDQIATGNMFPSDAVDEVYANNSTLKLYVHNAGSWRLTSGTGTLPSAGRIDDNLTAGQELFYTIGSGNIYQAKHNWGETSMGGYTLVKQYASNLASGNVGGNTGWSDMIIADVTGDGQDEIISRKQATAGNPDRLHVFETGSGSFSLATAGSPVGNSVTRGRDAASDGVSNLFYTNFRPMPADGTVESVRIYSQGDTRSFSMYQLRPTGNPDEYDIIYDSGSITAPGGPAGSVSIAFPNGPTNVKAGDLFAHYGAGIPYSAYNGNNASNAPRIYYPADGSVLVKGSAITLGSAALPQNATYSRDYAWAVDWVNPFFTVTDATPTYQADVNYNRVMINGAGNATLDGNPNSYDDGNPGTVNPSRQQYVWYDLSSMLDTIPQPAHLVSATLSWSGHVTTNDNPADTMIGLFASPEGKGIADIFVDDDGNDNIDYYSAHLSEVVDETLVGAADGPLNAEWDLTDLLAQWLADPNDPLVGQIVLLNSHNPIWVDWSSPGPMLTVVTQVPEPSSILLATLGVLALLFWKRRMSR